MKTIIIAVAAMAIGTALGFLICGGTVRYLRGRVRSLRKQAEEGQPQKMGVMDKVLILEAVLLVAYTIADMVVFWHTGSEPYTLTGCVFGVCGIENGIMGWIKTTKEKKAAEPSRTSQAADQSGPEPEREEPPDVGQ